MKKFDIVIGVVVLTLIAIGITIAIGVTNSSNNNSKAPSVSVTTATTAPVPTTSSNYSVCSTSGSQISGVWQQYAATLQEAENSGAVNDSSVIAAAASTGHALINATRVWVANCASMFPSEAARFNSSLSTLEPLINQLG